MAPVEPIFINGRWREADASDAYRAIDPTTAEPFGPEFPQSNWADVDAALTAAGDAVPFAPDAPRAALLRAYADAIDAAKEDLAAIAARETALPSDARFRDVEIPRTIDQLRQAVDSVDRRDWQSPTIDTRRNIRSCLDAIGTVAVFGPANFPFAYNAIAGTDFASAIAAGCRVIGRAHPSHPNTTKRLMELLVESARSVGVACPAQLLYGFSNDDGLRLAGDARLAAIGFTGSRGGGLALKAAADKGGVAFFGELSSINPVLITAAALTERGDAIAEQYVASVLLASGQMCTNPGLVFVEDCDAARVFVEAVASRFRNRPPAPLLNENILRSLERHAHDLREHGTEMVCGGRRVVGPSLAFENTMFLVEAQDFVNGPATYQVEMFGNACLVVWCDSRADLATAVGHVDTNLTGSVYFAPHETEAIRPIVAALRRKVGRLLTNAMPTGVAVSPAMNHGGPYPASTSAAATAVGFPAAIRRFARLDCYDRVVPELLPDVLKDENPTGATRLVDGRWTGEPIGARR